MKATEGSLGLRAVRTGAGRDVPWDDPTPIELSPAGRDRLGQSWAHRFREEHKAVGVFSILASEAAAAGASPVVLSLLTRAANDEVRHADLCRRYAALLLGEAGVETRLRGVPPVPAHRERDADVRALLHVVEMCCLNETMTGAYLTEALERATHPIARALVLSLLEDEIDHGRVGWAYLVESVGDLRKRAAVAEALPAMLDRSLAPILDARPAPDPEPAIERYGYVSAEAAVALTRSALSDLVLRGMRDAGIDVAPAAAHARARGWLPV